jgi:glycosyl transferase-like sugar-binding protein
MPTTVSFCDLVQLLSTTDSPKQRRERSRHFDARLFRYLDRSTDGNPLPQIHCFYEAMGGNEQHLSLSGAMRSMRSAGHPVRLWSYSTDKLKFLAPLGVELRAADEVLPRSLFERVVQGSEIRYFSDLFRYAVLHQHGGLWMDTDVVVLRPFPFRGDYFFNLQWRGGDNGHFVCTNVIYAAKGSRHCRTLYGLSIDRFFTGRRDFGDIGPKLLSEYIASDSGTELRDWVFSPMVFNSIDWTETDLLTKPVAQLADYLNDERVHGVHLWNARTHGMAHEAGSLIALLSEPQPGTKFVGLFKTENKC